MPDRPVSLGADGSAALHTGRFYRVLLVVNGEPSDAAIYDAVGALGFARDHDLAVSFPADWAKLRPKSWPLEHPPVLYANEQLVRASGSFLGESRTVPRDAPVAGGASMTVAELWDSGAATEPVDEPEEKKKGAGTIIALGIVLGACITYKLVGGRHEEAKETKRLSGVEARTARILRIGRVNELQANGHSRRDAEALAEAESWGAGEPEPRPEPSHPEAAHSAEPHHPQHGGA